jgi:CRISPR-associated protein Csb2
VLPSAIDSGALVPAVAELVRSAERGRDSIELHWGSERWQVWQLSPTDRPALASQKPDRWTGRARLWTTATPIALDRFPKANDDEARRAELADIVGRACENIGLPRPTHVEVSIASPLSGTVAARISRQARPWEHWQLPPKLVSRALLHATVGFEHTIEGPIVLGAGRFVGLGLCLPVMEEVSRG